MPQIQLRGDELLLLPDPGSIRVSYFTDLTADFDEFREEEKFADVTIWCSNGQVRTHKIVVANKSKLLSAFFRDNPMSSDIICPDFCFEVVAGFLDLLYTGKTVKSNDFQLQQIKAVNKSFNAIIELSDSAVDISEDEEVVCLCSESTSSGVNEVNDVNEVNNFSDESLSDLDEGVLQAEEEASQSKDRFEVSTMTKNREKKTQAAVPTLECPDCGKTFVLQIALNKHRRSLHQPKVSATSQEKPSTSKQGK